MLHFTYVILLLSTLFHHPQAYIPQATNPFRTTSTISTPDPVKHPQPQPFQIKSQHKVHFEHFGFLHEIAAFTHVQMPLRLDGLQSFCNTQPGDALRTLKQNYHHHIKTTLHRDTTFNAVVATKRSLDATIKLVDQNCNVTNSWVTSDLTLNNNFNRQKRFGGIVTAGAFALGSAFGGFISSWLNNADNSKINNKIQLHDKQIKGLTGYYGKIEQILKQLSLVQLDLAEQVNIQEHISAIHLTALEAARIIDQVHNAITSLLAGKLSLNVLTNDQLHKIFQVATKIADAHSYSLPIQNSLQLLELPATFTREHHGIVIQLFIPLVMQKYTMYRYLKTPVFVHHPDSPKLARIQPIFPILAIDDGGSTTNIPLHHSSLDPCIKLGNHYLCTDLIKHLRYESSCIGTMFSKDSSKILRACDFSWDKRPYSLDKISNSSYLLSTTSPMTLQMQCKADASFHLPAKRQHMTIEIGQTPIPVSPGCSITTDELAVSGSQNSIVPYHLAMPIHWDLETDLLDGWDLLELGEISQRVKEQGLHDIDDIKTQVEAAQLLPHQSIHATQVATAILATILAAAIIIQCTPISRWLKQRRRRRQQTRREEEEGSSLRQWIQNNVQAKQEEENGAPEERV